MGTKSLLPPSAPADAGDFQMPGDAPIVCGSLTSLRFQFSVGGACLNPGAKLRIGLPNTGWEKPVVPQQRYWDELVWGHPESREDRFRKLCS